jgi:hypothetical protein
MMALAQLGRKVRTARHRVPVEKQGFGVNPPKTVRATVTNRVAPSETTKRLGTAKLSSLVAAILPAATAEFHLIGDVS